MATIDITEQSFAQTLEDNDIVFVDFWAAWCGPCRMFAPTYGAAAERHPDITFAKVTPKPNRPSPPQRTSPPSPP